MASLRFPVDLQYSPDHQWVRVLADDDSNPSDAAPGDAVRATLSHDVVARVGMPVVRVGMTDYAQDTLGDLQFLGLPAVGRVVAATEPYADAEASKAVSDVYAPVSGVVVRVNEALFETPSLVNTDPYGAGWLIDIAVTHAASISTLLSAAAYRMLIGEPDQ
jgi:glycine cleavage system H protein